MGKRKGFIALLIFLLVFMLVFLAFYFTRPLVVFFTGDADSLYVSNLVKPAPINLSYRTRICEKAEDDILNKADLIINHSVIGLNYNNVYDVTYDLQSLIAPYIENLGDGVIYLYDSTDPDEVALLGFLRSSLLSVNDVSYEGEIRKADYGVYKNRVGDGLIITTSLEETVGFIRSLESPQLALTYLDAAALETIEPVLVFSPDWDAIIRENL